MVGRQGPLVETTATKRQFDVAVVASRASFYQDRCLGADTETCNPESQPCECHWKILQTLAALLGDTFLRPGCNSATTILREDIGVAAFERRQISTYVQSH